MMIVLVTTLLVLSWSLQKSITNFKELRADAKRYGGQINIYWPEFLMLKLLHVIAGILLGLAIQEILHLIIHA